MERNKYGLVFGAHPRSPGKLHGAGRGTSDVREGARAKARRGMSDGLAIRRRPALRTETRGLTRERARPQPLTVGTGCSDEPAPLGEAPSAAGFGEDFLSGA